ncbi:MAG: LytTR family DNA-binding domain-containing protein [Pseudomonadota bacterium]
MGAISNDIAAEKRADRASYCLVLVFTFLSWLTLSISSQIDAVRAGTGEPAMIFWFTQFTSHVVVAVLALIVPFLLTRFPPTADSWRRSLAGFGVGFIVFGLVHVLAMVALRKLGWPLFFEGPYVFGLDQPLIWFYELQKDAYTFLLLTSIFWVGRYAARQRLEKEGRREEAQESGRMTLTSGGRIYVVTADEVRVAKSAANYVEIELDRRQLLVRMTLSELERLLNAAGDNHVRIHRSCIVHKSDIEELRPNGDGTASIILKNGTQQQASRSYRAKVQGVLSAS